MGARIRPMLLAGVAAGLLVNAGPAAAASAVTSGWWTTSPVVVAPDASDGRLLVQGGSSADEPAAYAGISFVLAQDEQPGSLTLVVAPEAASTPASTLSLCALDAPATEASGEPADGAPAPDCSTQVQAEPSDDGSSYTFDVTAFAAEGSLDVAVLPGQVSDRVVLEPPTIGSLTSTIDFGSITDDFGSGGPSTPAPPPPPSTGGTGGATTGGSAGSFSAPRTAPRVSVPPAAPSAPVRDAGATATPDEQRTDEVAAPQQPAPFEPAASTGPAPGSSPAAGLLALGLAAAAATLWTVAGNGSEDVAAEDAA